MMSTQAGFEAKIEEYLTGLEPRQPTPLDGWFSRWACSSHRENQEQHARVKALEEDDEVTFDDRPTFGELRSRVRR